MTIHHFPQGLTIDTDDTRAIAALKAGGFYEGFMEVINEKPGKDCMIQFQDAGGYHAVRYCGNPQSSGFVHYRSDNPAVLLPLLVEFAESTGSKPAAH